MFNKISRWFRSKAGQRTMIGALAVVLIVVIVGQLMGWWQELGRRLLGTPVAGGYHCMPSCNDGSSPELTQDGKFLSAPGEDMSSFGGEKIVVWVEVDPDQTSFEIGIFDGDSGKDDTGAINLRAGHWDDTTTETTYTLYTDRLKDGATPDDIQVGQWLGQQMPNNAWFNTTLNTQPEARAPSGYYFYRLEATRPIQGTGINAFKLRSTGTLSSGQADVANANFAIVGMITNKVDRLVIYPQFQNSSNPGPSNYTGDWQFYFVVPTQTARIELWNGDFDRGTRPDPNDDSDDPNTVGKPEWASAFAVPERAGKMGIPADDFAVPMYRVEPEVQYGIIDPAGTPIYTDTEPSGTEEWERFVMSTPADPNAGEADKQAPTILDGLYLWHIVGLDLHNTVWVRFPYCMTFDPEGCKPVWPEKACPRTIGYWKNNFNKVFGDGKGNAQETADSLTAALNYLGQVSPLYRHGINVQNPQPLPPEAGPLTPGEALMILQRKDVTLKDKTKIAYPGGKDQYNSMLARALQQDLATWLNFTSGKIGKYMYVELAVNGTPIFQGSLWNALQEAQNIVFTYGSNRNAPELERAKDIGDQINNGNLGEDAPDASCETNPAAYQDKIPPAKQPKPRDQKPKADKRPNPPNPTPVPPGDKNTCGLRTTQYVVENPTNNPFYGIKFEFQSGPEIKDSDFDEFKVTLPSDKVAAMTAIQMEAKASTDVGQVTLECKFDQQIPCGPVTDASGLFAFTFVGANDNGDGTMTLRFWVQNMSSHGLSHVTIGLPDGVVPSAPRSSYKSQVCPDVATPDEPLPPPPQPGAGNLCASIFSPGYWKNWQNHYTPEQFQALIQKTAHYSTKSVDEVMAILTNNADQYHRHLMSAELNVALDAALGAGQYNFNSITGQTVSQVLETAFNTDPAAASPDLVDSVLYLGSNGEGEQQCRATP